jgi:hypothetical protein
LLYVDSNLLSVSFNSHSEVLVHTGLVVGRVALGKEVRDLVHQAQFSNGDEEIVS